MNPFHILHDLNFKGKIQQFDTNIIKLWNKKVFSNIQKIVYVLKK